MSISKITAALASASNEITLAAANLNFDFTLIKLAAPKEFLAIGPTLSNIRRDDAENGPTHTTARKLGALFEELIPSTPNLIRAYGLRASEISASSTINPKGSSKDGFFASQVGLDGTGLWAAATSGTAAISVHLLACMLARIWSPQEATSIWVQIVDDRRKEVERTLDEDAAVHYRTYAAARQDITRQQLADWDASARSWLQEADQVHKIQQQQLLLIANNLHLQVNSKPEVYASVISAWKIAMQTLNSLIQGIPQQVQDGSVLLGLLAWHIYPDINVFGSKEVKMNDSLVADGGTVTLGLQANASQHSRGVYWSLSLAHLKFYGKPVQKRRSTKLDTSRISIDQLWIVAFGSLWNGWKNSLSDDVALGAKFITALWTSLDHASNTDWRIGGSPGSPNYSWLKSLAFAATSISETDGDDYDTAMRLFGLGRRIGARFLVSDNHPSVPPAFGLSSVEILLQVLSEEDGLLMLFRQCVNSQQSLFSWGSAIIRYVQSSTDDVYDEGNLKDERNEYVPGVDSVDIESLFENAATDSNTTIPGPEGPREQSVSQIRTIAYASPTKISMGSKKRSRDGVQEEPNQKYCRWIANDIAQYFDTRGELKTGELRPSEVGGDYNRARVEEHIYHQAWDNLHSIDKETIVWAAGVGQPTKTYKLVCGTPDKTAFFIEDHETWLLKMFEHLIRSAPLPWQAMTAIVSRPQNITRDLLQIFYDKPFEAPSEQSEANQASSPKSPVESLLGSPVMAEPHNPDVSTSDAPRSSVDVEEDEFPDFMSDVQDEFWTSAFRSSGHSPRSRETTNKDIILIDPNQTCLEPEHLDSTAAVVRDIDTCLGPRDFSALNLLHYVSVVYQLLPHATIPCNAIKRPIMSYSWAKSSRSRLGEFLKKEQSQDPFHLTRVECFKAIASFETGNTDVIQWGRFSLRVFRENLKSHSEHDQLSNFNN